MPATLRLHPAHALERRPAVTTAQLFAEAIDTAGVLLRAGAVWLVLVALAATLALYAAIAVVWAVCQWVRRGVWRGCAGAWRLRRAFRGPRSLPAPSGPAHARLERSAPSWAHTDTDTPTDIEEAA